MNKQITDEQVADLLADSARYIEENGWTRHELRIDHAVCTVGAMLYSQKLDVTEPIHTQPLVIAGCQALVNGLGLDLPDFPFTNVRMDLRMINAVTEWNDDQVEDVQTILDALRKVEKIERNGGVDPDE